MNIYNCLTNTYNNHCSNNISNIDKNLSENVWNTLSLSQKNWEFVLDFVIKKPWTQHPNGFQLHTEIMFSFYQACILYD